MIYLQIYVHLKRRCKINDSVGEPSCNRDKDTFRWKLKTFFILIDNIMNFYLSSFIIFQLFVVIDDNKNKRKYSLME